MLRFVAFKWKPSPNYRSKFAPDTVNVLRSMVRRHYRGPHEFVCVTDDAVGIDPDIRIVPLWDDFAEVPSPHGSNNPSCYRRLKLFSAEAAQIIGERFCVLDLDCVITGDLGPLVDVPNDFKIWGDTSTSPYNGSMWLLRAGTRTRVWSEFDPIRSPMATRRLRYIGSDQAWIAACLGPKEAKWTARDGVYSFRNEVSKTKQLPKDARVVFFHGRFDPWQPDVVRAHPWIKDHYR